MQSDAELVSQIKSAFSRRILSNGRIIRHEFDVRSHAEAARVDAYIRSASSIDRSNSAQSAFIYLLDEAALAALPLYLISIITQYKEDDYINYVVLEAIAPAICEDDLKMRINIGSELSKIATADEAKAICSYIHWYLKKSINVNEINKEVYGPLAYRSIELWCCGRR